MGVSTSPYYPFYSFYSTHYFITSLFVVRYGEFLIPTSMNAMKRNLTARYFSLDEILAKNDRSELIDLIQDPAKVANMQTLLSVLDDLREEFGKPIIINSFYRDSAHNHNDVDNTCVNASGNFEYHACKSREQ